MVKAEIQKIAAAFDRSAGAYDELWTNARAGRLQRDAVWRNVGNCFPPDTRVLDLGCGTGEDALWLIGSGVRVTGIDASPEMVAAASRRGVDALCLAIEDLDQLPGTFDGAISNFGPLNCVHDLENLCLMLARKIRPGGKLALCIMGRFCLWETLSYLLRGRFRKAVRRWSGSAPAQSLGLHVTYPTMRRLRLALAPDFTLLRRAGIGITVPPSFIRHIPDALLSALGKVDRLIERLPIAIPLADHRLLIFVRK